MTKVKELNNVMEFFRERLKELRNDMACVLTFKNEYVENYMCFMALGHFFLVRLRTF